MNRSDLEDAIQSSFEGSLSEDQCRELRDILKSDPSARALYYQYADLHQSLTFRLSRLSPFDSAKSVADVRLEVQRRSTVRISLIASLAALLMVGLFLKFTYASRTFIATYRPASGSLFVVEHRSQAERPEGELAKQSVVNLSQGSMEFTLRNGSRSVVLAPARFELKSGEEMILHEGTAWFTVSEQGKGFRVVTGDFVATDLGTEFGVVAQAGESHELHVFSGRVQVEIKGKTPQVLTQGQACRRGKKAAFESMPAQPKKFLTRLPEETGGNLIANGNFEFGTPPPDSNFGVRATAALLPGWNLGRDITIAHHSENGVLGLGSGWSNLLSPTKDIVVSFSNHKPPHAVGTVDDSIWQTFYTEPGREYEIGFDMGGYFVNRSSGDVSITATVFDGRKTQGPALASVTERRVGNRNSDNGFNPRNTFRFIAPSSSCTLMLTETSAKSENASPVLDNVTVKLVPLPAPPASPGSGP